MKRQMPKRLKWYLAIVLLIIVFLRFEGWLQMPRSRPRARIAAAGAQINAFSNALVIFKGDTGFYPAGTNGLGDLVRKPVNASLDWRGPYFNEIPLDPWGHPYLYVYPGKHKTNSFDLSSAGPDGVFGTADDIGNWPQGK